MNPAETIINPTDTITVILCAFGTTILAESSFRNLKN